VTESAGQLDVHGISQIYHTYLKDKHSILHFQFASTAPISGGFSIYPPRAWMEGIGLWNVYYYAGVTVGLEMASYTVSEEAGSVTVCAAVISAGSNAQQRSVSVTISALVDTGDTADGMW